MNEYTERIEVKHTFEHHLALIATMQEKCKDVKDIKKITLAVNGCNNCGKGLKNCPFWRDDIWNLCGEWEESK